MTRPQKNPVASGIRARDPLSRWTPFFVETRGWYHGGPRPSSDNSFHGPTVIPPSALDKPRIMKRYKHWRTTRWGVTACSLSMVTLPDTRFVECRWWNDDWTVKTVVNWQSSDTGTRWHGDECIPLSSLHMILNLVHCLYFILIAIMTFSDITQACLCWDRNALHVQISSDAIKKKVFIPVQGQQMLKMNQIHTHCLMTYLSTNLCSSWKVVNGTADCYGEQWLLLQSLEFKQKPVHYHLTLNQPFLTIPLHISHLNNRKVRRQWESYLRHQQTSQIKLLATTVQRLQPVSWLQSCDHLTARNLKINSTAEFIGWLPHVQQEAGLSHERVCPHTCTCCHGDSIVTMFMVPLKQKQSHTQKSYQQMVNPRDIARNAEEKRRRSCHGETEAADLTCCLTPWWYTDTRPTSSSTYPLVPDTLQSSH